VFSNEAEFLKKYTPAHDLLKLHAPLEEETLSTRFMSSANNLQRSFDIAFGAESVLGETEIRNNRIPLLEIGTLTVYRNKPRHQ
jgi:hypothetical protein